MEEGDGLFVMSGTDSLVREKPLTLSIEILYTLYIDTAPALKQVVLIAIMRGIYAKSWAVSKNHVFKFMKIHNY